MRAPHELGRLIARHHPIEPAVSLAICAAPGLVVGGGLALGAVGSPALGGFAFLLMTALLVGLFAESLFVRQQVFEHGLLLSSVVPMTPRYAIPYATIDPDTIAAAPYHRPKGMADITDAFNRRYRQAPTVDVVTFVGPAPAVANRLASGRVDWPTTVTELTGTPRRSQPGAAGSEEWCVSFRDHAGAAADLRQRVRAPGPTT